MNLTQNFIKRQLKENAIYVFLTLALVVSFIASITIFINKKIENEAQKTKLTKEVRDLKRKVDFIKYQDTIESEGIDIDVMNSLLSRLVPETEDYFSIINALETLSQKSGFLITTYSLNLGRSTKDKLSLVIEGTGDENSFLNFLRDYTFGGGRLITIDNIDYETQGFFKITLSINLYSGKGTPVTQASEVNFSQADRDILREIQEKMTVDFVSFSQPVASEEYETKSNPF